MPVKRKTSIEKRDKYSPLPFFNAMDLTELKGNDDCFYINANYLFHIFYYGCCDKVMAKIRRAMIPASSGIYNHILCHDIEEVCYCIKNPERDSNVKKITDLTGIFIVLLHSQIFVKRT